MMQTAPSAGLPAAIRRRPSVDDLSSMIGDAGSEPKTLYVNRPLKNPDDVIAWARAAGFKKTLPASDMHVTIAFSRAPVDWDAAEDGIADVVVPQGARSIERLGDKGAVVLRFESSELFRRWQEFRNAGASWDHDGYRPHITLTYDYDAGRLDLSTIEPYMGPLEFGGEVFAEIDEDSVDKAKASLVEIKNQDFKVRGDLAATDAALRLALDRDSVRDKDRDGRMRIKVAHISKATVNPYKGHEIPDWEKLGLDPNRVYQLLRDPDELAKAAPTFNGIQLLRKHMPVSATDAQQWDVVGATGTDAVFNAPYLDNSLVIWTDEGIDYVESDRQKELSCGYHYRADMTPGNFDGMDFDGVMREIVGNHIALVKDGRAGPDVVVGDSSEEVSMSNTDLARKINAIANRTTTVGALVSYLRPRLAMDARIDMGKVFDGVTGKNFKEQKPVIAKRIVEQAKGKLAKDASLDDVEKVLDMLDGHEVDGGDESVSSAQHNAMEAAANGQCNLGLPERVGQEFTSRDSEMDGLKGFLKEKGMGEDDINTACGMLNNKATDEDPEEKKKREAAEAEKKAEADKKAATDKAAKDAEMEKDKDKVTKPAMDAAIAAATADTTKKVRALEQGIRVAVADVRPYIGELPASLAFDSADDVYRHAAVMLNVPDAKTIHPSALPTIIKMMPKAGAREPARHTATLGMDAAATKSLADRFPGVERITNA